MSEKLGPMTFGQQGSPVFLGRDVAARRDVSDQMAQEIDSEINRVVMENYERTKRTLAEHMTGLKALAEALIEKEVLDGLDVDQILMQSTPQMATV
jgi:cell division protease FtsH